MKKAVYQNPQSQRLYAFADAGEGNPPDIRAVFDNAKKWDSAPFKVDKKGRAYKLLEVEEGETNNGYRVFRTV